MASKNKKKDKTFIESDELFVFIAGYTSSGIPYGIIWEEMNEEKSICVDDNEELPFT